MTDSYRILVSLFFLGVLLLHSCVDKAQYRSDQREQIAPTTLIVRSGIEENGLPTADWLAAIQYRHTDQSLAELRQERKLPTDEEQAWIDLISSKQQLWPQWIDSLSIPFNKIPPPDTVTILLGNNGGADAFTGSDSTICFDLSKMNSNYGSALLPENSDRIDRFFAHEMTHILHKAWNKEHHVTAGTPLEYALWDCLAEGIGNYRSLSKKWVSTDGQLTPKAENVLTELQPILVERLIALRNATPDEAETLMSGLSTGPFTKKWGALTCALWLAQEAKGNENNLKPWIEAGPLGILDLAHKYLPADLSEELSVVNPK